MGLMSFLTLWSLAASSIGYMLHQEYVTVIDGDQRIGYIQEVRGSLQYKNVDRYLWNSLEEKDVLPNRILVSSGNSSFAKIALDQGQIIELGPGTQILLDTGSQSDSSLLELFEGIVVVRSDEKAKRKGNGRRKYKSVNIVSGEESIMLSGKNSSVAVQKKKKSMAELLFASGKYSAKVKPVVQEKKAKVSLFDRKNVIKSTPFDIGFNRSSKAKIALYDLEESRDGIEIEKIEKKVVTKERFQYTDIWDLGDVEVLSPKKNIVYWTPSPITNKTSLKFDVVLDAPEGIESKKDWLPSLRLLDPKSGAIVRDLVLKAPIKRQKVTVSAKAGHFLQGRVASLNLSGGVTRKNMQNQDTDDKIFSKVVSSVRFRSFETLNSDSVSVYSRLGGNTGKHGFLVGSLLIDEHNSDITLQLKKGEDLPLLSSYLQKNKFNIVKSPFALSDQGFTFIRKNKTIGSAVGKDLNHQWVIDFVETLKCQFAFSNEYLIGPLDKMNIGDLLEMKRPYILFKGRFVRLQSFVMKNTSMASINKLFPGALVFTKRSKLIR